MIRFKLLVTSVGAFVLLASLPKLILAADADSSGATTANAIITVQPSHKGNPLKPLAANDVLVYTGKALTQVTALQSLQNGQAQTQLFLFLDDSTRNSALGPQIPELKKFVRELPQNTQIAIGYMRNGGFDLVQPFTSDHDKAAESVRLPQAIPGINGSPYFALSYLMKHWPSEQTVDRRAVLMLTDGVDRYYDNYTQDDPYVDAAIKDAQHFGVLVYSIYIHGAGLYSQRGWGVTMSQSRLEQVSRATGGEAFFQGFSSPVSVTPYLEQLQERLNNQYRVTFVANKGTGLQKVDFRSEIPGLKITAPQEVLVKANHS
jgi:hypothetical protein